MDETHESSETVLEILLGSVPAEKHGAIRKAWYEHVLADPESIAAQWALIHYSLAAGMKDNTTRVAALRLALLETREQLERRGGELTSEFRLEDGRTAAKMADYLKIIEDASRANLKHKKELEDEIEVLRSAVGVIKTAGDEARRSIREMEKAVGGYFGMTAGLTMFLTLCVGTALGFWLATR